jgi:fatty-acyl-CoA synthase
MTKTPAPRSIDDLLTPRSVSDRPTLITDREQLGLGDLAERTRRAAGGLRRLGIGPGEIVVIWMPNSVEWLATALACARLGALVLALNPRFRAAELDDLVARSGARIVVFQPRLGEIDFAALLAATDRVAFAGVRCFIANGADHPIEIHGKRVHGWTDLLDAPSIEAPPAEADASWIVFTTSGTTSRPKFAVHTQRSILAHAGDVARAFYAALETVMLQALPLSGTFGFAQMMGGLAAACPVVLPTLFEAERAARLIAEHRVTEFNGTDEMIARMLDAVPGEVPFPRLRGCGYAAFSPALADLPERAARRGLRLFGLYGSSEAQALFARQKLDATAAERSRPGGFPVSPSASVRVRDPATGEILPAGRSGEIELKGASLFREYLGNPAATEAGFTGDGFFRSGDLGHIAADGSFVFETRMGDVLRLGGYLVAPSEIEAHLQRHATIDAAQVVGIEHEGALRPVAFVTLRQGAVFDGEALRLHCAGSLARFKVPVAIYPLDAFPLTQSANGLKVQKTKLRETAQRLLGS